MKVVAALNAKLDFTTLLTCHQNPDESSTAPTARWLPFLSCWC